ncbi:mycothiol system anti-sigma-R factor [Rhodococcus triatomae]|uniref:Mycothiol system anti-sigma-R factor n=1 Tax=Rhodococcus triatomae TaxID=300028 RepID=A0A1G8F8B9_9NOCA|nr:mycothiol system anti-sigma-R factor [Rhodococcus triatomae]QNG19416.1 mycothiol system anti-sigma-R factor [Rhodococcus triatomae]QNG24671.1 mycothiol system anti-sigma-R factor [Rhodococcus triatomae]SDH78358.1 mycothiol system anti-sigma-R factor [Rhodococcus triatomae]
MSEQDEFERLDCSAVIADVWLMLDGECDDASRARLERHLDECGSCFEAYGIEEKVKSLVNRKCGGEHAPDGLRERLTVELRRTVVITRTQTADDAAQSER